MEIKKEIIIPVYIAVFILGTLVLVMDRNNPVNLDFKEKEKEAEKLSVEERSCSVKYSFEPASAVLFETDETTVMKSMWRDNSSYEDMTKSSTITLNIHELTIDNARYRHIFHNAVEISGDWGEYPIVIRKKLKDKNSDMYENLKKMYTDDSINGDLVTLYGDGDTKYNLAVWENEKYNYSVYVKDEGISLDGMLWIIKEIS